jgi:hypothetical protein
MYDLPISPSALVRSALLCGVVAPLLYAFTVFWGATLFPGYSHISDPISSLTQAGRHSGIVSLFLIYNVLILNFAFTGISLTLGRSQWGVASYACIILTAAAGLLMAAFPQDPVGTSVSSIGVVHIELAGIASLGSIGAVAFAARAAQKMGRRKMAAFDWACLAVIVVFGALAAAGAALGWPTMGLLERVTIGGFEVWLLVQSAVLLIEDASIPELVRARAER